MAPPAQACTRRRRRVARELLAGLVVTVVVTMGAVAPAAADQKYVFLPDLRIVYSDPESQYLVPHVAQSFLSALSDHERLWDYQPYDPVNVLLKDFADLADASTIVVPRNRIYLDITPSTDPYETV
jgi:hypothetical protein